MMKIVAGLGALEDYEKLVKAGADELFTGYVPLEWNLKYGNSLPLNRREVLFYHTHIGTLEDMKILREKVNAYKVPLTIAMNALYYTSTQIEEIVRMVDSLCEIGCRDFIMADINLIREIVRRDTDCRIHISGEVGQWNVPEIELFNGWFGGEQTKRIIFHRKNDIEHMRRCIEAGRRLGFADEYEAFLMNEKCHYTGGFCNSLHCDELVHLCQLEYRLTPNENFYNLKEKPETNEKLETNEKFESNEIPETDEYIPGETGCGMCSLYKMREAGITHLKIVGRGASAECVKQDIIAVRRALDILEKSDNEENYIRTMKKNIFDNGCSGECYYENIR